KSLPASLHLTTNETASSITTYRKCRVPSVSTVWCTFFLTYGRIQTTISFPSMLSSNLVTLQTRRIPTGRCVSHARNENSQSEIMRDSSIDVVVFRASRPQGSPQSTGGGTSAAGFHASQRRENAHQRGSPRSPASRDPFLAQADVIFLLAVWNGV